MGRICWVDAVKGVAILLVMFTHLSEQAYPLLTWLSYGYVPIFFVMIGLTYHPICNWKAAIIKRSKRLWIPYLFYGVNILIITSLLSKNVSFAHGLLGLCYGRYCLYSTGGFELLQGCYYLAPLWFLPCLWVTYLLMQWQDSMQSKWILPVIALAISIATQYTSILLPFSIDTCFTAFLFMEMGRHLGKIKNIPLSQTVSRIVLVVCCIAYYIIGAVNGSTNMSLGIYGQMIPWSIFFFLILGITESIGLAILFRWIDSTFICQVFAYIGREALRLMCIHVLFGSLFYKGLCLTSLPHSLCLCLAILGVIGCNAMISLLINRASHLFGKELVSNL